MDLNYEEKLHEYFTNRPVGFVIYFTLSTMVSTLGIFGNFMLIYTKLRRFSFLSGLDFLTINLAFAITSGTSIFVILLTEEMFHEFTNEGSCNTIWILQGFSQTSIAFSTAALIIASKFFSKLSRRNAAIIIFIIFSAAILDAYPFFNFEIIPLKMRNGKSRNVCHLSIESLEDYFSYLRHSTFMVVLEFVLPAVLLIITSCLAFLWRKRDSSTNKIIFTYSLTIAIYYMTVNTPLVINRFLAVRQIGQMNLDFRHIFRFLVNLTVLVNPVIYGYFDDFFIKEVWRILTFTDAVNNVQYEHHVDKEIEDA